MLSEEWTSEQFGFLKNKFSVELKSKLSGFKFNLKFESNSTSEFKL